MEWSAITFGGSQDANAVHNSSSSPRVGSLTAEAGTVDVVDNLRWGRMDESTYVG